MAPNADSDRRGAPPPSPGLPPARVDGPLRGGPRQARRQSTKENPTRSRTAVARTAYAGLRPAAPGVHMPPRIGAAESPDTGRSGTQTSRPLSSRSWMLRTQPSSCRCRHAATPSSAPSPGCPRHRRRCRRYRRVDSRRARCCNAVTSRRQRQRGERWLPHHWANPPMARA